MSAISTIHTIPKGNNDKIDLETYCNLYAAVFAKAKDDWESSWRKIKRIEDNSEYSYELYLEDEQLLRQIRRTASRSELLKIKNRMLKFEGPMKYIGEIKAFLKSSYFENICYTFDLEPDAVREAFNRSKDMIMNSN